MNIDKHKKISQGALKLKNTIVKNLKQSKENRTVPGCW